MSGGNGAGSGSGGGRRTGGENQNENHDNFPIGYEQTGQVLNDFEHHMDRFQQVQMQMAAIQQQQYWAQSQPSFGFSPGMHHGLFQPNVVGARFMGPTQVNVFNFPRPGHYNIDVNYLHFQSSGANQPQYELESAHSSQAQSYQSTEVEPGTNGEDFVELGIANDATNLPTTSREEKPMNDEDDVVGVGTKNDLDGNMDRVEGDGSGDDGGDGGGDDESERCTEEEKEEKQTSSQGSADEDMDFCCEEFDQMVLVDENI